MEKSPLERLPLNKVLSYVLLHLLLRPTAVPAHQNISSNSCLDMIWKVETYRNEDPRLIILGFSLFTVFGVSVHLPKQFTFISHFHFSFPTFDISVTRYNFSDLSRSDIFIHDVFRFSTKQKFPPAEEIFQNKPSAIFGNFFPLSSSKMDTDKNSKYFAPLNKCVFFSHKALMKIQEEEGSYRVRAVAIKPRRTICRILDLKKPWCSTHFFQKFLHWFLSSK